MQSITSYTPISLSRLARYRRICDFLLDRHAVAFVSALIACLFVGVFGGFIARWAHHDSIAVALFAIMLLSVVALVIVVAFQPLPWQALSAKQFNELKLMAEDDPAIFEALQRWGREPADLSQREFDVCAAQYEKTKAARDADAAASKLTAAVEGSRASA